MLLILMITNHVSKTCSKVRISKGVVFKFELEAHVKGNDLGRFPTYRQYNKK